MTSFNFFKRDCACFQWGGVSLPERSSDDEGVLYRYKNGKSNLIYNAFYGRNFVVLEDINAVKTYWIKWQTTTAANRERNKTTSIFFFSPFFFQIELYFFQLVIKQVYFNTNKNISEIWQR